MIYGTARADRDGRGAGGGDRLAGNEGAAAARALLETLRSIRGRTVRVRWILCGSVGIHHALRVADATAGVVNDLRNIEFGPLDPDSAAELARRLFIGISAAADDDAVGSLARGTDGIPYFMHAVASQLEVTHSGSQITGEVVSGAIDGNLRSRDDARSATHLLSRIDIYYGDLREAVYRVLDEAAATAAGVPLDPGIAAERTNELIDLLIDDHYLVEDAGPGRVLRWRYPLLRRIWAVRRRLE